MGLLDNYKKILSDYKTKVIDEVKERVLCESNNSNKNDEKLNSDSYFNKIFKPTELLEGNYYLTNGILIKGNVSDEDVYIALPFAGTNLLDVSEWNFQQGFVWKKLEINHNFLKKFAGLVYNETSGQILKEALSVANAVYNYAKNVTEFSSPSKAINEIVEDIIYFKKPLFYTLDPKPLQPDSKIKENRNCFASIINIFTQNKDFSGGATHWDGADFLQNGANHQKVVNQGVEIDADMWSNFKYEYSENDGIGVKNFGKINIQDLPKLKISASASLNKDRILFKSSAQYGGHLFWKPNFQAPENEGYQWKYLFFSFLLFFCLGLPSCGVDNTKKEKKTSLEKFNESLEQSFDKRGKNKKKDFLVKKRILL